MVVVRVGPGRWVIPTGVSGLAGDQVTVEVQHNPTLFDRVELRFADGTALLLERAELPDGFWEACGLPYGG